ncbi:MAG: RES family NAD+ phosphorylase [Phycisphaerales bacterium]|nr:RES family NAD+ phosphorylase [Phycisphaerales bacterium]MBT7171724.1 RES family NAD+ phosphorylase [Phycisphaerales bacterium]
MMDNHTGAVNPFEVVFNPETLLTAIAKYRSSDLRNIPVAEVRDIFSIIFSKLNLITANLGGIFIFRVREIKKGEEHRRICDIWSPPAECASLGRANDAGESIFYGALDPVTAIREISLQPGNHFTLGNFWLSQTEDDWHSSRIITIPKHTHARNRDEHLHSRILSDFIFSEFTRPVGEGMEFQYKASCAISKLLLDRADKDSLIFPSICDSQAYNLVMKNEAAEKRLHPKQVFRCRLDGWSEANYPIITIEQEGNDFGTGGVIDYQAFHPDAKEFEFRPDKFFKGENPNQMVKQKLEQWSL